jgi:hypothetical protein
MITNTYLVEFFAVPVSALALEFQYLYISYYIPRLFAGFCWKQYLFALFGVSYLNVQLLTCQLFKNTCSLLKNGIIMSSIEANAAWVGEVDFYSTNMWNVIPLHTMLTLKGMLNKLGNHFKEKYLKASYYQSIIPKFDIFTYLKKSGKCNYKYYWTAFHV